MLERDYLMRSIAKVAQLMAYIAGLSREGKVAEAEQELEQGYSTLLGLARRDAHRLSPATLVMMVGQERGRMLADLLECDAAVLESAGRGDEAQRRRRDAASVRKIAG